MTNRYRIPRAFSDFFFRSLEKHVHVQKFLSFGPCAIPARMLPSARRTCTLPSAERSCVAYACLAVFNVRIPVFVRRFNPQTALT